jgi:hypothetical protein
MKHIKTFEFINEAHHGDPIEYDLKREVANFCDAMVTKYKALPYYMTPQRIKKIIQDIVKENAI